MGDERYRYYVLLKPVGEYNRGDMIDMKWFKMPVQPTEAVPIPEKDLIFKNKDGKTHIFYSLCKKYKFDFINIAGLDEAKQKRIMGDWYNAEDNSGIYTPEQLGTIKTKGNFDFEQEESVEILSDDYLFDLKRGIGYLPQKHKYYFGFPVMTKRKSKRGEVIEIGNNILDSNGEFVANTIFEEHEKAKFVDSTLSNKKLRCNLEKVREFQSSGLTIKDAFNAVRNCISEFWRPSEDEYVNVVSAYVIYSYFYPLFPYSIFLNFMGESGTGKSKITYLLSNLVFNGMFVSSPTPAAMKHMIKVEGSVNCLDEAECLVKQINNLMDENAKPINTDVVTIMLSSHIRGMQSLMINKDAPIKTAETTELFAPFIISSISGIKGPLESKSITLLCTKTSEINIMNKHPLPPDAAIWNNIRTQLYIVALKYWQTILDYEENDNKLGKFENINGRNLDVWKPLLAILKETDETLYQNMVNFIEDYCAKVEMDKYDPEDWTVILKKIMVSLIPQNLTQEEMKEITIYVDNEEIWIRFKEIAQIDENNKKELHGAKIWVGRRLSKIGLKNYMSQIKIDNENKRRLKINLAKLNNLVLNWNLPQEIIQDNIYNLIANIEINNKVTSVTLSKKNEFNVTSDAVGNISNISNINILYITIKEKEVIMKGGMGGKWNWFRKGGGNISYLMLPMLPEPPKSINFVSINVKVTSNMQNIVTFGNFQQKCSKCGIFSDCSKDTISGNFLCATCFITPKEESRTPQMRVNDCFEESYQGHCKMCGEQTTLRKGMCNDCRTNEREEEYI